MGAVVGLCDRLGEPGTAPAKRVSGNGKPDPANEAAGAAAIVRSGACVTLAEIGKRVGRKALREIACVAKPDTILAWYRKLIAQKFDGSAHRQYPGRPRIDEKLEALIVRMARENSGWGYDRIVGTGQTWVTRFRIRPLATFCVVTPLRRLPGAAAPCRGRISWRRT